MKLYNYKLIISYDGHNYYGWQIQKKKVSIQETIQNALKEILQEDIILIGSGRTDALVHAIEQIANFKSKKLLDSKKILYSLNRLLPKDIRILKIEKVEENFHARFSAKSKIYRYYLDLSEIQGPFSRLYSYKPTYSVDIALLKKATECFLGKHDFSAFANKQLEGIAKTNPVKTMKRIDIIKYEKGIILEFEADGFLYKMVRNIVGMLLEVASNRLPIDCIENVLKSKDRKKAAKPAPAHGLFLKSVIY